MEQAERRRKLAAKRREKVLRGGKSRLDYITGKVDEPPPKSRVAKVGPSTSDGETKRPDALETVISNASTARPTVSEECPAERTAPTAARHEAVEREGDRASAPKVATTVARSESRVLVYIRRLLPCVLALVYYAHVSSGYALGTSQSAIALARSAPAWFITYEVRQREKAKNLHSKCCPGLLHWAFYYVKRYKEAIILTRSSPSRRSRSPFSAQRGHGQAGAAGASCDRVSIGFCPKLSGTWLGKPTRTGASSNCP